MRNLFKRTQPQPEQMAIVLPPKIFRAFEIAAKERGVEVNLLLKQVVFLGLIACNNHLYIQENGEFRQITMDKERS